EDQAADVVVAAGPNMFYTVTLPVTLWFLDRGKKKTARADNVLFVDARHIYRQLDRAHRDWTPAQISFLANIVRLYRGEDLDFTVGGDEAQAKITEIFGLPSPPGRGTKGEGSPPVYRDTPGLCKAAKIEEIAANG